MSQRIKKTAEWCIARGINVIPIGEDKKPAVKWKQLVDEPLKEWDYPGCNIAILTGETNNLVVVDCDNEASWLEWMAKKPRTPVRVKSKRGMHFYYRWPGQYVKSDSHVKLDGHEGEYDVRGDYAYVLLPPSLLDGYQYQFWPSQDNPTAKWMDIATLPEFDPAWRPDRVKADKWEATNRIRDARAYLDRIVACEGQGGDKQTLKACCKLAASGYSEAEAMALLVDWNSTNCTPPWTTADLLRKLQVAYSTVTAHT
jgi:hypothetical protein